MWLLANRFRSWDKKRVLINSVEFIWSVTERIAAKAKLNSKVKIPFHAEISWISCVASDWCQNVTSVTINDFFFIGVCVIDFLDSVILPYWFVISIRTKKSSKKTKLCQWFNQDVEHSLISKTASSIEFPTNRMPQKMQCFCWNSLKSILKKTALHARDAKGS